MLPQFKMRLNLIISWNSIFDACLFRIPQAGPWTAYIFDSTQKTNTRIATSDVSKYFGTNTKKLEKMLKWIMIGFAT